MKVSLVLYIAPPHSEGVNKFDARFLCNKYSHKRMEKSWRKKCFIEMDEVGGDWAEVKYIFIELKD